MTSKKGESPVALQEQEKGKKVQFQKMQWTLRAGNNVIASEDRPNKEPGGGNSQALQF